MRAGRFILGILVLPAGVVAAPPADLSAALQACAAVTPDAARLACYDRLAGPGAPGPASAPAPAAVPAPAHATPSFGLYAAEHPSPPPVASSLSARVVGVGTGADGHMTATLEGGEVWELDEADPLLAAGDTVTISRARLGSFLMQTPSKRTHRVRRLH